MQYIQLMREFHKTKWYSTLQLFQKSAVNSYNHVIRCLHIAWWLDWTSEVYWENILLNPSRWGIYGFPPTQLGRLQTHFNIVVDRKGLTKKNCCLKGSYQGFYCGKLYKTVYDMLNTYTVLAQSLATPTSSINVTFSELCSANYVKYRNLFFLQQITYFPNNAKK